jgi:hypothetical protein
VFPTTHFQVTKFQTQKHLGKQLYARSRQHEEDKVQGVFSYMTDKRQPYTLKIIITVMVSLVPINDCYTSPTCGARPNAERASGGALGGRLSVKQEKTSYIIQAPQLEEGILNNVTGAPSGRWQLWVRAHWSAADAPDGRCARR